MTLAFPGPAYRIHTPRLVIRCWDPRDAPALKAAIDASLEHLRPWLPWVDQEPEALQAKVERLRQWRGKFDLGQDFTYGLLDPEESQVLGAAGLHTRLGEGVREIGYWVHQAHTGRGLATEAAAALTRVAFEVEGVQRVEIRCDPANQRSAAVPRKLGFLHEATLGQRRPLPDGRWGDTMIWTLFAGDYAASPAAQMPIEAFDVLGRRLLREES
jgi:RimJ/RimL family protein N-acetyltransferase